MGCAPLLPNIQIIVQQIYILQGLILKLCAKTCTEQKQPNDQVNKGLNNVQKYQTV